MLYKMNVTTQKQDLINWLVQLEDQDILKEIETIKHKQTFEVEKAWKESITGNDLRKSTKAFIKQMF